MFKLSRQQKDHRYFCGNRYEKYSIKKLKVGATSVLIGASFFFGYHVEASEPDAPIASVTDSGYNRTETGNSTVVDAQEFVMVTHEKPGGVVEDVAILKSKFSENLEQLKKEYPGFTATSLQSIGNNKYKITYVPVAATNRVQQQNLQLIQERLVLQIVHQQLLIKHKQQLKIELVYKDI